jgi:hypothetical protein
VPIGEPPSIDRIPAGAGASGGAATARSGRSIGSRNRRAALRRTSSVELGEIRISSAPASSRSIGLTRSRVSRSPAASRSRVSGSLPLGSPDRSIQTTAPEPSSNSRCGQSVTVVRSDIGAST